MLTQDEMKKFCDPDLIKLLGILKTADEAAYMFFDDMQMIPIRE